MMEASPGHGCFQLQEGFLIPSVDFPCDRLNPARFVLSVQGEENTREACRCPSLASSTDALIARLAVVHPAESCGQGAPKPVKTVPTLGRI